MINSEPIYLFGDTLSQEVISIQRKDIEIIVTTRSNPKEEPVVTKLPLDTAMAISTVINTMVERSKLEQQKKESFWARILNKKIL